MSKPESKKYLVTTDNAPTAIKSIEHMIYSALRGGTVLVTLGREKRSNSQNSKQWPMLQDISEQVDHFGRKYDSTDWKHILTAGLKGQELVPGVNGQLVALPSRTSGFSTPTFSEYIEFIYWFGAENEVKWSEKSVEIYEEYEQIAQQNRG